jgi:hypothetical protein
MVVNVKLAYRIYRDLGLTVRKRRRKKDAVERQPRPAPERPNQRWSVDFVSDSLSNGRRIRCLTIVDDFTRECPAIEVDNGPEFGGCPGTPRFTQLGDTKIYAPIGDVISDSGGSERGVAELAPP